MEIRRGPGPGPYRLGSVHPPRPASGPTDHRRAPVHRQPLLPARRCLHPLRDQCPGPLVHPAQPHLQLVDGCTSLQAGLVVLPGAAIGAVLAPLSGRLYDQLGPRIPIISGSCVALIGLMGFALTARRLRAMAILILYIFFMLGIGLSFGNIMTNGLHRLSQEQQADGNAIFNTVQQFAAVIGSSLAATIVAAGQAAVADRRLGTISGSQHALILLLVIGTLEVLLILAALRRTRKQQLD